MDNENILAVLYQRAETLQSEARNVRDQIAKLYSAAGEIKALTIHAAETLTSSKPPEITPNER